RGSVDAFIVVLVRLAVCCAPVGQDGAWPTLTSLAAAMRTCLLACLLLVTASSFVDAKKKSDLDELESLLENIDEDQDNDEAAAAAKPTKKPVAVLKNPCEDHVCGWGKECVVGKKGEPHCECISKCPELDGDPMDKVCRNNNETFVSALLRASP
ncbi:EGF like subdomain protein, partial [Ostertagia ostertagi]